MEMKSANRNLTRYLALINISLKWVLFTCIEMWSSCNFQVEQFAQCFLLNTAMWHMLGMTIIVNNVDNI